MFKNVVAISAMLTAAVSNTSAANLAIPNSGFETPVVGAGQFQYTPSSGSWSWSAGSGVSGNGSGFTANNPNAPEGAQVGILQGGAAISQQISGFSAGITYTLRFHAAQRNYAQAGQNWNVQVNGTVVGTFAPPQSAQTYTEYTANFTTTAGTKELKFQGVNSAGGDNTAFIDNVRIEFTPPGNGTGLRGEYWNNLNHNGTPALTRTDATVDFDWGDGSPGPGINTSTFTTRWTGKVQPPFSETYTFYTVTDDGARLWVNGVQLVNDWTDHPATERSGTIALTGGQQYDIVMEQYDGGGGAVARLLWSSPSTPKAVIPQTQLYLPATTPAAPSALAATAQATNRIRLTWTDNANNENGFAVERKTGAGGTYAQIASVAANTTTYTNTSLAANTQYYYRIRATNASGASAYSAEANATTYPFPPAAPSALSATAQSSTQIRLAWTDNANNETGFKIERKTGAGGTYAEIATVGANVTVYTNTGLSASTTYFYRVRANNLGGDSAFSSEASATTPSNCGALPSPFASQDIGAVGFAGGVCYSGTQFTIRASGSDIWETADAFHYVYQSWTGNVEVIARVLSVQNTDAWAKSGVMIRESLNANSIHALMVVTPGSGSSFQRRKTTGGSSDHTSPNDGITAPHWVRLVRNGTTFTGYRSSDGTNWIEVGSDTVTMASTFRVGVAVTAHNNGVINTSVVDNVLVRVPATPSPNAPSGLAATPASSSQINLSWTDNANNETGFEVERKQGAGGTYANIGGTGANVTTFNDSGLAANTTYFYRVRAFNSGGSSAYAAETSATTQPNATGTGLYAEYFNNVNLSGSPTLTRTDAVVDFTWGQGSPHASLPIDNFSVRWTGRVQPQFSETYTFYTLNDDGTRLWVNGVLVINDWTGHGATEFSGNITLTAGQQYDIVLEYFESIGDAIVRLSWSSPSTAKAVIPQARLYPVTPPPPTAPAAPSSLAATAVSANQINLTWTDNSNSETQFKIERKTGAGGTYAQIATPGANTTSHSDTTVSANTTYYYRVRANNAGGDSPYSNEANATTPSVGGGTDYEGRPFVTQAAPVLTFQRKTQPNLTGIDYAFAEQTARGVALLSRFPAFTLSDRRIHVDGPWYDSMSANLHFSRGIQSVGAIPRYREIEGHPTNVRLLAPTNKWQLMTDPLWYQLAINLANQLEGQNPSDPRVGPLRTFGINHLFSNDEATFRELGRYGYNSERWPTDINGNSVRYPCLDIETTGNFEFQRNCMGWMYQGMAESAAAIGQTIIPMLYAQWQYSVGAFFESSRQGGFGDPEYLLPERDFLGGPDPTIQACQDNKGIISMDGYMRALWTRDQPFYKRNPDGSLQLSGGLPIYNDATSGSAYGWNLLLESGEAKHCLDDLYTMAVRMYIQHHRFAGQYPAHSGLRKSFLTNAKVGAWQRYSNEGLAGIQQNDRPMPDWILDLLTGMYLFTADDLTLWSSDMNYYPGPIGGNYTNAWRYNAHGVLESVVKAAHRYSANDPLHATAGTYQWCWFNLPVINQNNTAGDRYFEKPIAFGKLRQFEGHTYLEMFVAWPALDSTSKTFKVWVDKNGTRSNAYTIQLPNGRSYFYDAWQLPDSFTGLEGQHIWLRTTDMFGNQRTWRGDWRVTADNGISTPPDF